MKLKSIVRKTLLLLFHGNPTGEQAPSDSFGGGGAGAFLWRWTGYGAEGLAGSRRERQRRRFEVRGSAVAHLRGQSFVSHKTAYITRELEGRGRIAQHVAGKTVVSTRMVKMTRLAHARGVLRQEAVGETDWQVFSPAGDAEMLMKLMGTL